MSTAPADLADLAHLAWFGEHAAARLPREVHLHADGPLAATVGSEITRLRSLAEGAPGSLALYDLTAARAEGTGTGVLDELEAAGAEAFALRTDGEHLTLVGGGGRGLLYGFYAVLRGTGGTADGDWSVHSPAHAIRMLDHWDNMTVHPVMGQVERGYAGGSLFYEHGELRTDLTRVEHYARLLGSIGINRVALNNVNVHAHEATLLTTRLDQVARLAEIFRAQGISVLLSVSFASPILLGGLEISDPLDIEVQDWWRQAADAVYARIPDFGGFVVKADSEGQPGPFAYGRDHADGANLLARALAPHGGEVFWRAFVYDHHQDWRDRRTDRARAAHDHFTPLDGRFDDNVIVQVKHGPMDFQTREAVSPVIGAMPRTRLAVELQVTQEYTGQQKHLCYLAPWWSENLRFPFGDPGLGAATLAQIVAGTAGHHYGPDVDGYEYTPWGTYHFADRDGIGVDRTVATGTGFAGLYPEPWASLYESAETCPDELLLFFHHVPYTHRLHSGKTVIQHIYDSRADAFEQVLTLRPRWQELEGRVPMARHARVTQLLREQERSAEEWRDQLRTYFFRASGIPDASGRPIY